HTATPSVHPLSLHDALPILRTCSTGRRSRAANTMAIQQQERGGRFNSFERKARRIWDPRRARTIHRCAVHAFKHRFFKPITKRRSEEHTSELQSRGHLVCRL